VTAAVGAVPTGLRISPQNGQNDIADSDPQSLLNRVAAALFGADEQVVHPRGDGVDVARSDKSTQRNCYPLASHFR